MIYFDMPGFKLSFIKLSNLIKPLNTFVIT